MLSIKGTYDGKTIKPLDNIPINKPVKVIITFIEETSDNENENIRRLASESDAFVFWEDEKEDLYQDYIV